MVVSLHCFTVVHKRRQIEKSCSSGSVVEHMRGREIWTSIYLRKVPNTFVNTLVVRKSGMENFTGTYKHSSVHSTLHINRVQLRRWGCFSHSSNPSVRSEGVHCVYYA